MSKWTEIRDGAIDAMKQGAIKVGEQTKQEFLNNFVEAGIPVIEKLAEQFTTTVKAQAETETGWCKIRDAFVIPFAVDLAVWAGKKVITMVQSQTTTAAQATA